jgi:hypothetical protein
VKAIEDAWVTVCVLLLVLKASGVLTLDWMWVVAPIWVPVGTLVVMLVATGAWVAISGAFSREDGAAKG